MKFFRLSVPWDDSGNNPYPWVDSADGLFGPEELHKVYPVFERWTVPRLLTSATAPRVDAYCCPGGFFMFSSRARTVLGALDPMVEWLPVEIMGLGQFLLLHPLRSCKLGPQARFRRNEVSLNIASIDVYDFEPSELGDTLIFCPAQPSDSAAGQAGFYMSDVVATELPALIWQRSGLRGVRFQPLEIPTFGPARAGSA